MDPITEAETAAALAELHAQHSALMSVRDTVEALTSGHFAEVMPTSWSGAAARAYELRLDDVSVELSDSTTSLGAALEAVRHDIASVRAESAASIGGDHMKGTR